MAAIAPDVAAPVRCRRKWLALLRVAMAARLAGYEPQMT
jgi:hypothetical protein